MSAGQDVKGAPTLDTSARQAWGDHGGARRNGATAVWVFGAVAEATPNRDRLRDIAEGSKPSSATPNGQGGVRARRADPGGDVQRIQVIGEVVARLSRDMKDRHPEVPGRRIADMRNLLVLLPHVDREVVWAVVAGEVPVLKEQMEHLLGEVDDWKGQADGVACPGGHQPGVGAGEIDPEESGQLSREKRDKWPLSGGTLKNGKDKTPSHFDYVLLDAFMTYCPSGE